MQDKLILLVIGAIIGFISALIMEIIRDRLARGRREKERNDDSVQSREREIKDFLSSTTVQTITPSWLKLRKTKTDSLFFRKAVTVPRPTKDRFSKATLEDEAFPLETTNTIKKFLLTKTQVIGRQEDCEIQLSDPTVSRLHALVRFEEGNFVIYDLGSNAGVLVNDVKVNTNGAVLYNGDQIQLADSIFLFETTKANPVKRKKGTTTKSSIRKIPQKSTPRNKS